MSNYETLSPEAKSLWWLIDSYEAMTFEELCEFEENDLDPEWTDAYLFELDILDLVRETDGYWDIHCSENYEMVF